MTWRARVDANQLVVAKALRRVGASVQYLFRVGQGCPDLLVGFRGRNYLLEVKSKGGSLTESEQQWHLTWAGKVHVVHSPEEALTIIQATPT